MAELRDLVFNALDNGVQNGHEDEQMNESLEDIAINLIDYDCDIWEATKGANEEPDVMDLIPHIEAWRAKRILCA